MRVDGGIPFYRNLSGIYAEVIGVPEGIGFVDIHSHILFGVDDGAETPAVSARMLEAAYRDGVRGICCTPHFYNPMVPRPKKAVGEDESFSRLAAYVREKYPDMRLWRGNEIFYHHDCIDDLTAGRCRSRWIAGVPRRPPSAAQERSCLYPPPTRWLTEGETARAVGAEMVGK